MSKASLLNIIIGFSLTALSAAAGPLLGYLLTDLFINNPELVAGWNLHVLRSAHAHLALFGLVHVAFGLTLIYSRLPKKFHTWQTLGLIAGDIAVGPGLVVKSNFQPVAHFTWAELTSGFLLASFVLAIVAHIMGLSMRLIEK